MHNKPAVRPIVWFILVGIVYLLCVRFDLFSIPCPFHALTGYQCPGCGITTMFLRLSYGDFAGAYAANPVVLLLSPVILLLMIHQYNSRVLNFLPFELMKWVCLIVLLVWGVVRNL